MCPHGGSISLKMGFCLNSDYIVFPFKFGMAMCGGGSCNKDRECVPACVSWNSNNTHRAVHDPHKQQNRSNKARTLPCDLFTPETILGVTARPLPPLGQD